MALIRQNMELVSDAEKAKAGKVKFENNVIKGAASFAYAISEDGRLLKAKENRWIDSENTETYRAVTLPFFTPQSMNKIILCIKGDTILYIDDEGNLQYEKYRQEDISKDKKDI